MNASTLSIKEILGAALYLRGKNECSYGDVKIGMFLQLGFSQGNKVQ